MVLCNAPLLNVFFILRLFIEVAVEIEDSNSYDLLIDFTVLYHVVEETRGREIWVARYQVVLIATHGLMKHLFEVISLDITNQN